VEAIKIVAFDDGTLTAADRERLQEVDTALSILGRVEADDLCVSKLMKYPTCLRFRAANILFRKLFDLPLATAEDLYYVDSDIYFLKPFAGLFSLSASQQDALFMDNGRESYSARPWHLLRPKGLKLASRVNTGIICLRTGCLDLDYLEYFLKRWGHGLERHHLWWAEQTCWAAIAQRLRAYMCDSIQIAVMHPALQISEATCAVHFVSTYRSSLLTYARRHPVDKRIHDVVNVSVHRIGNCTALGMTKSFLRARADRLYSRYAARTSLVEPRVSYPETQ
jgi:hypothetical protein